MTAEDLTEHEIPGWIFEGRQRTNRAPAELEEPRKSFD